MIDVLVVGGGFSGLTAAWHFARRGLRVEVWEAENTPGGWVKTLPWEGPQGEPGRLDLGPESLRYSRGSALEALVQDLGLNPIPAPSRGPRWLLDCQGLTPWPTGWGWLTTDRLTGWQKLRLLMEPFAPPSGGPETLTDLMARRLGPGFAHRLWPALASSLVAVDPALVEASSLPSLPQADAMGGFLLAALREGIPQRRILPGGLGTLTQALSAGICRCAHPVHRLVPQPHGWRMEGPGGSREAAHVVLALPPHAAAPLLGPWAPQAAGELEAMASTSLILHHARYPASEPFSLRVHPERGDVLLGATGRTQGRGLQVRTYLRHRDPGALERLFPHLGQALQTRTLEAPRALPIMPPGHAARVSRVLGALPQALHWIGAWRFGPGLADQAEAIRTWGAIQVDEIRATIKPS